MEERIINAIKKSINKKYEVALESRLVEDLEVDSFDVLMILGAIEDEFDIDVDPEDFSDIKTVSDIVRKIEAAKM